MRLHNQKTDQRLSNLHKFNLGNNFELFPNSNKSIDSPVDVLVRVR